MSISNKNQWAGMDLPIVLREYCRKICICFKLNIRLTQVALGMSRDLFM